MTKRVMIKKFMKETGADKKTAMEYLRNTGWNYGTAIRYFKISDSLEKFGEAVKKLGEILKKIGDANKENKTDEDPMRKEGDKE